MCDLWFISQTIMPVIGEFCKMYDEVKLSTITINKGLQWSLGVPNDVRANCEALANTVEGYIAASAGQA